MNYYKIFFPIYQWAAKKMVLDCQSFIQKGSKILDLGCGSAIVAKNFQDFFQAKVIGVDIRDRRIFKIPFKITDGKSLPFPENSFDVVLISYVFHHSQNPVLLLKEAKRVAKDKIIIYEDTPENIFSKLICHFHSLTFNKFFRNSKVNFNFKKESDWEKIFEKFGFNVIFKKRVWSFPKKNFFVLEKMGA